DLEHGLLVVGAQQVHAGRVPVVPGEVPAVRAADVQPLPAVLPDRYDAQSVHAPSPHDHGNRRGAAGARTRLPWGAVGPAGRPARGRVVGGAVAYPQEATRRTGTGPSLGRDPAGSEI